MDPRINIENWLPGMIGPLEIQVNGVPYAVKPNRFVWNFQGGVTVADDPTYADPDTGEVIGRTVFSFAAGGGSAPEDTGFATVTGGAFDASATGNLKYANNRFQTSVPIDFKSGTKIGSLSWTPTNTRTIVLPDASGQVVLRDTVDTFTNKVIDLASATGNTLKSTGANEGDTLIYDGTKFVPGPTEDCTEPAETHQVRHAWTDAACTASPGSPNLSVESERAATVSVDLSGSTADNIVTFDLGADPATGKGYACRLDVLVVLDNGTTSTTQGYASGTATVDAFVPDDGSPLNPAAVDFAVGDVTFRIDYDGTSDALTLSATDIAEGSVFLTTCKLGVVYQVTRMLVDHGRA